MKVNPNNFFKRELDILPPHFVNTVVKAHEADIEKMRKWIYENCAGRYSITKDVIYQGDASRSVTVLGFENPGRPYPVRIEWQGPKSIKTNRCTP